VIVRRYAQILGIAFIVIFLLELRTSEDAFGVLNSDHVEDFLHLLTGVTMTYAGFWAAPRLRDQIVVAQALFYLVLGSVAYADPEVFGLFPHDLGTVDNVIHLLQGGLSLVAVYSFGVLFGPASPQEEPAAA
jgi:hypothetical protein